MFIVWTEKDGGMWFSTLKEAEQYAEKTGGKIEEVTEIEPDRWWIIK